MTPWPHSFMAKLQSPIRKNRAVSDIVAPRADSHPAFANGPATDFFAFARLAKRFSVTKATSAGRQRNQGAQTNNFRSAVAPLVFAATNATLGIYLFDENQLSHRNNPRHHPLDGDQPLHANHPSDSISELQPTHSISLTSDTVFCTGIPKRFPHNRWSPKGATQTRFQVNLPISSKRRPTPLNSSRFSPVADRWFDDRDHTSQKRNYEKNYADQCVAVRRESDCDHRRRIA